MKNNILNKFVLVSSFLATLIVLLEILQAVLFFYIVYSIFSTHTQAINFLPDLILKNSIIFLFIFLLIYFILLYVHSFLVQKYSINIYKENINKSIFCKVYREVPSIVKNYFNKISFEVLVRLGYGYYGSLSFIIARTLVTLFMVFFLAFNYFDIFMTSIYIALPAIVATLVIIYYQKNLGKIVSNWNNSIGIYTSKTISMLTISNHIISNELSQNEKTLLQSNALSQSLSNFNKPMIEFIIAIVLFLYFSKENNALAVDSIAMAIIYRIYGNLSMLVALFNQYSSSSSAKKSIEYFNEKENNSYLNVLNKEFVNQIDNAINIDFSKIGGIEIRGASGKGKTLTIEHLVNIYRNENISVFLWMNSLEFPDITVSEYVKEVLNLDDNLFNKEFNSFLESLNFNKSLISSLSLGQKSRLGLYLSSIIESDVVVLDEPFANLDDLNTIEFQNILVDISKTKKVVITNHGQNIQSFMQIELS